MKTGIRLLLVFTVFSLLVSCKRSKEDNQHASAFWVDSIAINIDNYLKSMESLGFSGAIVAEFEGAKILSNGYGFADRGQKVPFTARTVQSNGSNTKQFTGAAILLLESEGKLSLQDSLQSHFDGVPRDKKGITLHQLLTHSSGLILGVGADDDKPMGFDNFFSELMATPLQFEPGSDYSYSNAGYSILGRIVELVSGMTYETFLHQRFFDPLNMPDTGYIIPDWKLDNLAIGYDKGNPWGRVYQRGWGPDGPNWHLKANGGLHTTAEDMYRWSSNIKGDGILDNSAISKWSKGYIYENNDYSKYGYGLVTYEHERWGKIIEHSGSNDYFTSHFMWLPERKFFFYIHGNSSIFPAYKLTDDILNAAFNKEFNHPPLVNVKKTGETNETDSREGIYISSMGTVELASDADRLIAKFSGQQAINMIFNPPNEELATLDQLQSATKEIMQNLENGESDAFKGFVTEDKDSKAITKAFEDRIARMGRELKFLRVVGTFKNTPGSQLHPYGTYTSFVHARFENWNQYWNIVWAADGSYVGNYSGPWPEITSVPVGEGQYVGMRATRPWIQLNVTFEGDCLLIENEKFCADQK